MIIRTSGKHYRISRYGGTENGKNIESRIGKVLVGTAPNQIPEALVDDLTPKELRALREKLEADRRVFLAQRVPQIVTELRSLADAIEDGILDTDAMESLRAAADDLLKRFRGARRSRGDATKSSLRGSPPQPDADGATIAAGS